MSSTTDPSVAEAVTTVAEAVEPTQSPASDVADEAEEVEGAEADAEAMMHMSGQELADRLGLSEWVRSRAAKAQPCCVYRGEASESESKKKHTTFPRHSKNANFINPHSFLSVFFLLNGECGAGRGAFPEPYPSGTSYLQSKLPALPNFFFMCHRFLLSKH